MPPAIPTKGARSSVAEREEKWLREIIRGHHDWFMSIDGRSPLNLTTGEFEFSAAHGRLIFSCWTQSGSRTWRVTNCNWTGDKLSLQVTWRMGAETATIELIPRASAKAVVAGIAVARQERSERLAQLVAQTLVCRSP